MDFWWIPFTAIIGLFAVVIVSVVSANRTRRIRAELRAQVQAKLIDRFESAPELIAFLKSPTGQEFVSGVRVQQAQAVGRKTLGGLRSAVFLAALGLGFLILWPLSNEQGFVYPGVLLLALGGGFFAATLVSVKLSRAWGLTDQADTTEVRTGDVG